MDYKTIRISKGNWEKLEQMKSVATFDDIITNLLNNLENQK
jgi:predicted CopG family antitoxin